MKKKDIKNKIRESAISEIPDIIDNINLDNIEIIDNHEEEKATFKFNKGLIFTFTSLLVFISLFMIYSLGFNNSRIDLLPLETETELVGFQTVSAAALLSSIDTVEVNSSDTEDYILKLSESSIVIEDEIELITDYLNMAETVIGNEDNFIYSEFESDNPTYSYAFYYKGMDLSGNLIEYYVYYNQEVNSQGFTTIEGIMEHTGKTYNFSSSIIENDNGNIIQYQIQLNPNNYVLVTNTSDEESQKFSYQVYKNNNLFNSSEIVLTSESENMYATMTINQNQNKQLTLQFERVTASTDNSQTFQVRYVYQKNNSSESGSFNISLVEDSETGEYSYQYNFGNSNIVTVNRSEKGNQKASDEDFNPTSNSNSGNSNDRGNSDNSDNSDNSNNSNNSDNSRARKNNYDDLDYQSYL